MTAAKLSRSRSAGRNGTLRRLDWAVSLRSYGPPRRGQPMLCAATDCTSTTLAPSDANRLNGTQARNGEYGSCQAATAAPPRGGSFGGRSRRLLHGAPLPFSDDLAAAGSTSRNSQSCPERPSAGVFPGGLEFDAARERKPGRDCSAQCAPRFADATTTR